MFDVTLGDNFQYQSQFVDTDNTHQWDQRDNVHVLIIDNRGKLDTSNVIWGQVFYLFLKEAKKKTKQNTLSEQFQNPIVKS